MHARRPAGHTPGYTTAKARRRGLALVFACVPSPTPREAARHEHHPRITDDLAHTCQVLEALTPTSPSWRHPEALFVGKLDRVRTAGIPNPLVDRTRHDQYITEAEADHLRRLQAARAARP